MFSGSRLKERRMEKQYSQLSKKDISAGQKQLIADRQAARMKKDWAVSDKLRDELMAAGIGLRDGAGVQNRELLPRGLGHRIGAAALRQILRPLHQIHELRRLLCDLCLLHRPPLPVPRHHILSVPVHRRASRPTPRQQEWNHCRRASRAT